jgi:hypothetical protein
MNMACEYDKLKIGTKVIGDSLMCTSCWNSIHQTFIGVYMGHFKFPTGIKAGVKFEEIIICPFCDNKIPGGVSDCEDFDLSNSLFVKVTETISV